MRLVRPLQLYTLSFSEDGQLEMTTLGIKQHFLLSAMTLLFCVTLLSCTDKRMKAVTRRSATNYGDSGPLSEVADVTFKEQETTAVNMAMSGGSLYLTGYPFGFSRWDVGAEPEEPRLLAAASDRIDLFSPDPPFGGWTVDNFGIGALFVRGGAAYSSGRAGMSVISVGNASFPTEVERKPRPSSMGDQAQDLAYVYRAIVPHPSNANILFGLSEMTNYYAVSLSGGKPVTAAARTYPMGANVCCVEAATAFNGNIYVAMRSFLAVMKANGTGLQSVGQISKLQPINVVASANHLYVHHRPIANNYTGASAGIYVFDAAGNQVNFLPIDPLVFAVHPNDTHLYVNMDDLSVKIYRIRW